MMIIMWKKRTEKFPSSWKIHFLFLWQCLIPVQFLPIIFILLVISSSSFNHFSLTILSLMLITCNLTKLIICYHKNLTIIRIEEIRDGGMIDSCMVFYSELRMLRDANQYIPWKYILNTTNINTDQSVKYYIRKMSSCNNILPNKILR